MFLGLGVLKQKPACTRCGAVHTDRDRKGAEALCRDCEAAEELQSQYVWIGRCLVRRPADGG